MNPQWHYTYNAKHGNGGSPEMEDKKWVVNHTAACMLIRYIYDAFVHISLYLTTKEHCVRTDKLVLGNAK